MQKQVLVCSINYVRKCNATFEIYPFRRMEIKCSPVPLQSISPTFNKKVQRNMKQLWEGN